MRKVSIIVVAILGILAVPIATHAARSQLLQQILPTDCVLTVIANGSGQQQVVGECPAEAPIVTTVETSTTGQRFARGVFDSARTTLLKVRFAGTEYTAGTPGSPLTTAGDSWTFSIDGAAPNTLPGNYLLEVEALLVDGRVLSTSADFTLPSVDEVNPDTGFEPAIPGVGGSQVKDGVNAPAYLTYSLSPVDTIANGIGRPTFLVDDGVGRPVAVALLTEYGKGAILAVAVAIIVAGKFIVVTLLKAVRPRHH